jgi:signal transduction histidine kinase
MGALLLQTIGVTIRIETVLEKDLWAVMIDPTQLELVILNLAINSRDAMPNGGRLTVATKNMGMSDRHRPAGLGERDYVAISVSDTGSGMTQEVAAKAFEPFFTTKSVGQGTGLGLSQVLGFAQQSGGEVRIDSRVGQGTTITIFLPRSKVFTRAVDEARPVPHDGKAAHSVWTMMPMFGTDGNAGGDELSGARRGERGRPRRAREADTIDLA